MGSLIVRVAIASAVVVGALGYENSATADTVGSAQMVAYMNSLRASVGSPTAQADDRINRAAQAHADYLSINNQLSHTETEGLPGFTGVTARDRAAYQGYSASFVSENAASYSGGLNAMAELWHAPYHRLGMMHPHTVVTGWGHSSINGRERTVGNFIKNFSSPAPDFIRSPADGQFDIPTSWNGNESPNPLPAGAPRPTGYPIMVVYSRYQVVDMRSAEVLDPSGASLPIYYAPQHFSTDYRAIVPQQPLAQGTTYRVRFHLTVDGRNVTNEWSFTTAGPRQFLAGWRSQSTPSRIDPGTSAVVNVGVRNDGSATWPRANVRLSYHWYEEATGSVVVWDGNRGQLPSDVSPGQEVTVPVSVTAPPTPGRYRLQYDLVWELQFWFRSRGSPALERSVLVYDFRATYVVPSSITLGTNEEVAVPVTLTNTGTATWRAGVMPALNLGTHWYATDGALVQWDGVRTPVPQNVAPGQSVTFSARVRGPVTGGSYRVRFDLVYEGLTWFSTHGTTPGESGATVQTYGATYAAGAVGTVVPGTRSSVQMTLTNTGTKTWSASSFNLAYHLRDANGALVAWDGLRTALPQDVGPGQSVTVQAGFTVPTTGTYVLRWDMVQELVTWFSSQGVPLGSTTVTTPPEYGATYGAPASVSAAAGQVVAVPVTVTNTGWRTWSPPSFRLAYHVYDGSGRLVVWDGVRTTLAQSVGPGQSVTLQASLQLPAPGTYTVRWDMVQELVTWFSGRGVATASTSVTAQPEYGATYAAPATALGRAGQTLALDVTVTNSGWREWVPGAVNLSYHVYDPSGRLVVWDGARTQLPATIGAGGSATLRASVLVPAAGSYTVRWDLVHELVTWFSNRGVAMAATSLSAE